VSGGKESGCIDKSVVIVMIRGEELGTDLRAIGDGGVEGGEDLNVWW